MSPQHSTSTGNSFSAATAPVSVVKPIAHLAKSASPLTTHDSSLKHRGTCSSTTTTTPASKPLLPENARSPSNSRPPPIGSTTNSDKLTNTARKPKSFQRKGRSQTGFYKYIHQRQLKICSIIILCLFILDQFPLLQPYTRPFLSISYVNENSTPANDTLNTTSALPRTAGIGPADACFVLFCIVVLTFIRSLLLDHLLIYIGQHNPFFRRRLNASPKKIIRFAEQGYALFQYSTNFVVGAVLLFNSAYWGSAKALWQDWPVNALSLPLKCFYLYQLSIWVQQIYVINIEERRKDHWQMFTHHIVTCALIIGSYQHYLTRVGHVIMVIMDAVDIFLSLAKVLRYLGYQSACDACFVVFLVTWITLRHGVYNYVLYSAFTDAYVMLPRKCFYDVKVDSNGEVQKELIRCFTDNVYWTLVGLLAFLQMISIAWLYMIIRVLIRVLKGDSADDSRSDDEDEEEEGEEEDLIEEETEEEEKKK